MSEESIEVRLARLEERYAASQEILKLQAKEYERRLEGLNNEAARISAAAALSIPRETYLLQVESLQKDIHALEVSKANLEGKASQSSVTQALFIAGVGILLGIVAIAVRFLK